MINLYVTGPRYSLDLFIIFFGSLFTIHYKKGHYSLIIIPHPDPRGGGGSLIFSYIRRLGSFFLVQLFEFQYYLRFLEKMNIFGGM